MDDITKEELDLLEEVVNDAQSYYNCYNFYDHCSREECERKEKQAYRAIYIVSKLREKLELL